ncbi:MAG: hypothetical protein Q4A41_05475, partial [Bacillota bacterium]|nr:hypothetical protein [Bacillota bacterium]
AYIGVADDITVSAYQKFVDDFKVSYTPYDLVMQLNYDYENYSPRSVYLVIPRYENAVAHLTYGFDRGFCVMTVDQNENNLHPITILYGEKETEIQIPVDYKVGEFKIEQEGVVDFTEYLNLKYNPSVQIREEIEEFFSMVRTRG